MTYDLKPCPKPAKRKRPKARGLCRTGRLKARGKRTKKSGGALFWKRKDKKYRRWVWTENDCMLRGSLLRGRVSLHDVVTPMGGFLHVCWGVITPAHVGQHQARGAPDFGVLVPLCQAAHQFYDEHRAEWAKVTGCSERKMASEAGGYGLKYVEHGGSPLDKLANGK